MFNSYSNYSICVTFKCILSVSVIGILQTNSKNNICVKRDMYKLARVFN